MRASWTCLFTVVAALGVLSGCTPSEFSGIHLIAIDPYEARILEISPSAARDAGAVPADQLPMKDGQIDARRARAFVQNGAKLKVVSLAAAQDAASADHVISASWAPDGQRLLLVLDASGFGNDVYELRLASPELSTIRSARFRAPGFRKLMNQGLAISWSTTGRYVAVGPREDRAGWSLVDPAKLSPADAPAVFVVDTETMERTAHPGYHSAYFLSENTLIAARGDRVLVVNVEFKELGNVDLPVRGRVVASDPQHAVFIVEATRSHASLSFGSREYWLVQHPSLRNMKLPRGAPTMTFLDAAAVSADAPAPAAGREEPAK